MASNIDECIAEGGRITTKKLSDTQYANVCSINGQSFEGRIRDKMTAKEKRKSALARRQSKRKGGTI